MWQWLSVLGALMILAAFALSQTGRADREDRLYNLLNLVGSAILVVIAIREVQAGFIILEGAWAVLSLYALIRFRPKPR
ncbi:MAG: CBU_0592 family membrane protein [Syntrophomonadales bacterium]